jgi:hypothetical protein
MEARIYSSFAGRIDAAATQGEIDRIREDLFPYRDDPEFFRVGDMLHRQEVGLRYGRPKEPARAPRWARVTPSRRQHRLVGLAFGIAYVIRKWSRSEVPVEQEAVTRSAPDAAHPAVIA